jgi:hypothetical protein
MIKDIVSALERYILTCHHHKLMLTYLNIRCMKRDISMNFVIIRLGEYHD